MSAMFAPYEDGVPLLNISTFSTNVTLVEDSDIDRALSAFELPHRVRLRSSGEHAPHVILH